MKGAKNEFRNFDLDRLDTLQQQAGRGIQVEPRTSTMPRVGIVVTTELVGFLVDVDWTAEVSEGGPWAFVPSQPGVQISHWWVARYRLADSPILDDRIATLIS